MRNGVRNGAAMTFAKLLAIRMLQQRVNARETGSLRFCLRATAEVSDRPRGMQTAARSPEGSGNELSKSYRNRGGQRWADGIAHLNISIPSHNAAVKGAFCATSVRKSLWLNIDQPSPDVCGSHVHNRRDTLERRPA
jgi:hypothetical protein